VKTVKENKTNVNKVFLLISTILAQSLLVVMMVFYMYFQEMGAYDLRLMPSKYGLPLFASAGILLALTSLFLVIEIESLVTAKIEAREQLARLEKAEELVMILRSHRHDFLNHLSVISGFMQLKKLESAMEYIKVAANDLTAAGKVTNLAAPELAALILTKKGEAEESGIQFETNISTELAGLFIQSGELVRIVGNLIDNALYAVKKNDGCGHVVRLELSESRDQFKLSVTNTGSFIPEALLQSIFTPGFTTKGSEGSGYGLYNVHLLVKKNRGDVCVESGRDTGTTFTVLLPKEGTGTFL
jgi:sensor histidine kinase regulating citrate/malate metabolism